MIELLAQGLIFCRHGRQKRAREQVLFLYMRAKKFSCRNIEICTFVLLKIVSLIIVSFSKYCIIECCTHAGILMKLKFLILKCM